MRRLSITIVFVSLSLSSCSYPTDFAVVNTTGQALSVRYWLKGTCDEGSSRPALAPVTINRKISFGRLTALDVEVSDHWSPARHQATGACGIVSAELPPHQALRISQTSNYSRPTLDRWQRFDIERLEVSSPAGVMKLCGPAILVAFEGSREQQLLVIAGSPAEMHLDFCKG